MNEMVSDLKTFAHKGPKKVSFFGEFCLTSGQEYRATAMIRNAVKHSLASVFFVKDPPWRMSVILASVF